MGTPLSSYATQLVLSEEALLKRIAQPMLVWASTAKQLVTEEVWTTTHSGAEKTRPTGSDPIVFPVAKGNHEKNAFAMGVTIGRTPNNDVALDDPSVSRFHAYLQLEARTQAWRLVDAESSNGTFVDERRLAPSTPVAVTNGARIRFGSVVVTFYEPKGFIDFLRDAADEPG